MSLWNSSFNYNDSITKLTLKKDPNMWINIKKKQNKMYLVDVSPHMNRSEIEDAIVEYIKRNNIQSYWATMITKGDPPFCVGCDRYECKCLE